MPLVNWTATDRMLPRTPLTTTSWRSVKTLPIHARAAEKSLNAESTSTGTDSSLPRDFRDAAETGQGFDLKDGRHRLGEDSQNTSTLAIKMGFIVWRTLALIQGSTIEGVNGRAETAR